MSTTKDLKPAETIAIEATQPFHEVDGVVLKVGHTYDISTPLAEGLIASGAAKKKEG